MKHEIRWKNVGKTGNMSKFSVGNLTRNYLLQDNFKADIKEMECANLDWANLAQNNFKCRPLVNP
jgi:hypothetical protein